MNVEALDTAIAEFKRAVEELLESENSSLDDLKEWGMRLPALTYGLAYATRTLREHALTLGDQYVLSDDRGKEPEESIIESADALRALNTLLERADPAAREYWEHVQHMVVERELEPGEPPSLEVRTATAADMARRSESTTHVDREPYSLLNDTIFGQRTRP